MLNVTSPDAVAAGSVTRSLFFSMCLALQSDHIRVVQALQFSVNFDTPVLCDCRGGTTEEDTAQKHTGRVELCAYVGTTFLSYSTSGWRSVEFPLFATSEPLRAFICPCIHQRHKDTHPANQAEHELSGNGYVNRERPPQGVAGGRGWVGGSGILGVPSFFLLGGSCESKVISGD